MLGALANGFDLSLGEREVPSACAAHRCCEGVGRCAYTHRHGATNFCRAAQGDVGISFAEVDDVVASNRGDGGLRWRSGIEGQDGTSANHGVASHVSDVERDRDIAVGQASQVSGGRAIGVDGNGVASARGICKDQGSRGIGIQTDHGVGHVGLGAGVELAQGHADRSGVTCVGLCVQGEGNSLTHRHVARLVDLAHQEVVSALLGCERVGPSDAVVGAVLQRCTRLFGDVEGGVIGDGVGSEAAVDLQANHWGGCRCVCGNHIVGQTCHVTRAIAHGDVQAVCTISHRHDRHIDGADGDLGCIEHNLAQQLGCAIGQHLTNRYFVTRLSAGLVEGDLELLNSLGVAV